ncbi:MAG: DUF4124 domain-containing protein [Sideroxydans sp.]|jgi:hypothetical protein
MKTLLTFVLLAMFSLHAHAELKKWVDANGVVHYSDTPPAGTRVDSVLNVTGKDIAPPSADSKPKSYIEREVELKKARQEKQAASDKLAGEKAAQEQRQHNCSNARETLRALESGGRITTYDASGERIFLDDAAREQRAQDARAAVQAHCD